MPKVWKRPHSTIYGKNVEYGSSLYSDKIGELNGRKFNSELPWSVRNSGGGSSGGSPGASGYSQGYLSNLLVDPRDISACSNYADLLAVTNPRASNSNSCMGGNRKKSSGPRRLDFFANYMEFSKEIDRLSGSSLIRHEPLLTRKMFDHFLDYDYEIGLFVPNDHNAHTNRTVLTGDNYGCKVRSPYDDDNFRYDCSLNRIRNIDNLQRSLDINTTSFVPSAQTPTTTYKSNYNNQTLNYVPIPLPIKQLVCNTQLLPKHKCQIESSPYGQTADGRKLSLSSINPHSYRPSLPAKTTTARASDGEEFEFQDKSSPFYTDR